MPKFVIERPLPGAAALGDDEIRAISAKSNTVLAQLGDVQWLESHVTADKLYCIYVASPSTSRTSQQNDRRWALPTSTRFRKRPNSLRSNR